MMKITKLYPPKNNSFVLDDLPFRSMTLFGALANCYVNLFGAENFSEFLLLFKKGKIGSIFPALKIDGQEIFFLPKPYLSRKKPENDDQEFISKKKIKKIRWLSIDAMKFLGNSIKEIDDEFFHFVDFKEDFATIGKEFLIMKDELKPEIVEKINDISFYQKTDTVRVNIARFGQDSKPFDQSGINFCDTKIKISDEHQFKLKAFLYFPENIEKNDKWKVTKQLFAEDGIGGKRNLGKGWFEKIETSEINFDLPKNPKLYLLLSNLIPQKEELKNILSYDIGIDDGFITFGYASTLKKDSLFYLKEGAVIDSEISGKIVPQLFNDKTIYRYGKAFLLPLGGGNE